MNPPFKVLAAFALAICLFTSDATSAQDRELLVKAGEKIAFMGDSTTEASVRQDGDVKLSSVAAQGRDSMTLWYDRPADNWLQALPLGNGRMGAMVFGGAPKERLSMNEESLWAGELTDVYPENYYEHLQEMQKLILAGKVIEARQLGLEKMTKSPTSYRSFEPLCDLWIEMGHGDKIRDYRRQLSMTNGIVTVRYLADGVEYVRECFVSSADDVMAVRLKANKPGAINAAIRLTRRKDMKVTALGDDQLRMDGQIIDDDSPGAFDDNPGGSGPGGPHMKFAAKLKAEATGGRVKIEGDVLMIEEANAAVLYFSGATDYSAAKMSFDRAIDPAKIVQSSVSKAAVKNFEQLKKDHVSEHSELFTRVSLDLGRRERDGLPTDQRLAAVRRGESDPHLIAQYFQFGRYLLMASSRKPGRQPANLQGVWSQKMWAPWEADYHLNINLQMNYWPTDLCNLPGTIDPLLDWFIPQTQKGYASAKKLYDARGWVSFTTSNPFGRTTPGGSDKGSQFVNGVLDPLAGAWMAMTLWRHFEFTGDQEHLRDKAYPVLKGASEFILDYLVEGKGGRLLIVPSTSPENQYIDPHTGQAVRITYSSTYHTSIVRAVLEATLQSAEALNTNEAFRKELKAALEKLPPLTIGADGTICEWIEDYKERHPGHRHISHLIGVHPFNQITRKDKPVFEAAKRTIERRLAHGGGHTGWSRAWIVNFYARFGDGDKACENVLALLRKSTHPNLFDNHPPFQIDGNFGGTAGIAEMLLQSHEGNWRDGYTIHLLPALPKAWPTGAVTGLRARGGYTVDISWKDGKLSEAVLHGGQRQDVRIRYGEKEIELKALQPHKRCRLTGDLELR